MTATLPTDPSLRPVGRFTPADCDVDDFAALVATRTRLEDYPHADRVEHNVLVYESAALREAIGTPQGRLAVEAELARAWADGPGVVILKAAYTDLGVVDEMTTVFDTLIATEASAGTSAGDHFARPGANSRVWNALEKVALADPATFVDYYGNDMIALASHAWLGPGYQMTSQVNVVRPGGVAQDPHRDYHLGFLSDEVTAQYPAHVHLLSPVLTLQGAVAHSDMPVESGPTLYLPHSQKYAPGYLAYRRPEFRDLFADQHVQLPLEKGDAGFFNPALFHGAGSNVSSDIQRCANLLQVSSAFGRAMENVDRRRLTSVVFPHLQARLAAGVAREEILNALACAAEGYPFPTNLDLDQPVDGLTPLSQAAVATQALEENWSPARLAEQLDAHDSRRRTGV